MWCGLGRTKRWRGGGWCCVRIAKTRKFCKKACKKALKKLPDDIDVITDSKKVFCDALCCAHVDIGIGVNECVQIHLGGDRLTVSNENGCKSCCDTKFPLRTSGKKNRNCKNQCSKIYVFRTTTNHKIGRSK